MVKKIAMVIIFFITLVSLSNNVFAQGGLFADTYSTKVKLNVGGSSNNKSIIISYLNREFKAIKDVNIDENDPDWEMEILVVESSTKGGIKNGIILSILIKKVVDVKTLNIPNCDPKQVEGLKQLMSALSLNKGHFVQIGSLDEIESICKNVVAFFDGEYLEDDRKLFRQFKEYMKNQKKE